MTGTEGTPPAPWGEGTGGGAGAGAPGAGAGAPGAGASKKRKTGRNAAIIGGVALLLVVVGAAAEPYAPGATEINVAMNKDLGSAALNAAAISDLAFTVTGGKMSDLTVKLDGAKLEGAREASGMVFRPTGLADGDHTLTASSPGRLPIRDASESMSFTVDTTAPVVTVDTPTEPAGLKEAFTLAGTVEGAETLKINDEDIEFDDAGRFSKEFETAPRGALIVAADAAGNVTEQEAAIAVVNPGMRAVHMTGHAWGSDTLRVPVMEMLEAGKIDTIQLDIKDEDGLVGYESQVPLALEADATQNWYNIDDAVEEIHGAGGRIVGRIVTFRDPKLGGWALENGKTDWLIQNESGGPYTTSSYGTGTFTNMANQEVVDYNIDLGVEATEAGFDDIMFDYIRKPENEGQVYPGADGRTATELIVDFVEQAAPKINAAGAFAGAAVYGISAFTPGSVAQDIDEMCKHLDYVAPMVYPSHWGPNEYSVDSPNSQPYDIVHRSLMDFNRQVLGDNDCAVIPWLQDFSLGVSYGDAEVADQIRAAADAGINSWLLWNAASKYSEGALEVREASENVPDEIKYSMARPGVNPVENSTTDVEEARKYIEAYREALANDTDFVWPPASEEPESTDTESTDTESTDTEDGAEDENTADATEAPDAASTEPAETPAP